MSKETRAKILNLSVSILLGKATRTEIKKIVRLAKNDGELEFYRQEMNKCSSLLASDC